VDGMDEIVQEFLVESHENLDQLDRDFVALEQAPESRELLSSIFRTIHTIKGTSGFLAFGRLEAVTHVGENLLSRLRDGDMVVTPETTDALLRMVDVVRSLLAQIERTGAEGTVDIDTVVAELAHRLEAGMAERAAAQAPAAEAAEPADPAETAEPAAGAEPTGPARRTRKPRAAAGSTKPRATRKRTTAKATVDPAETAEVAEAAPAPAPAPAAPDDAQGEQGETPSRRSVAESSIRVDVDLLDALMRLVGELVLTRNQMVQHVSTLDDVSLTRSSQRLSLIASELQEGVMKTRMQPIDHLWSKLPRVVRDLGAILGKQVQLVMEGKETELDRTLLEAIKDPLTHIVRNSVDHGIETAAQRAAAGKSEVGRLTLRAFHEGGQVVVEVNDDGAGIDQQRVADKAIERGIVTVEQLRQMSEREILGLVFQPGFSTASAVTNVSGRGVGMDVVKTNLEKIGGSVEVDSTPGRGTTTRLTIPLTLAIVPALTVECGGERYAIPQVSLLELVGLDDEKARSALEDVSGAPVYRLRGKLLPLVRLAEVLGVQARGGENGETFIAVLQADDRQFGLVVDRVLNTEEIVVKSLSARLKNIGLYAGATILGDGRVALILDVAALARSSRKGEAAARNDALAQREAEQAAAPTERVLVAAVGDGRRVAIPLDMVTRLEEFPVDRVEHVGGREVVQYRDRIVPLIRLGNYLGAFGDEARDSLHVIVYTEQERSVALAVEEIVDIVEERVQVRSDLDDSGLTGSAVIRAKVTELLDVRQAILAADPRFYSRPVDEPLLEASF
jgi:two-component system chemotaxis sensor kinase CheA